MKKNAYILLLIVLAATCLAQGDAPGGNTGTTDQNPQNTEENTPAANTEGNGAGKAGAADSGLPTFDFTKGEFDDLPCRFVDKNHLLECNAKTFDQGNVSLAV